MVTLKILVVDDQDMCRHTVVDIITVLGHQAIAAESGKSAIKILSKEEIDFIISDISMPEMDGLRFFYQIREKWPSLANKFVFLTGGSSPDLERKIMSEEIPMFSKPVSLSTVKEILKIAQQATSKIDVANLS